MGILGVCLVCFSFIGMGKMAAYKRIAGSYTEPTHYQEIYSIAFGTLLGDGLAEWGPRNGTMIRIYQSAAHSAYVMWLYDIIHGAGYCSDIPPRVSTRSDGTQRIRFNTFIIF